MLTFQDNRLIFDTATQIAVFDGGALVSLTSKIDGKEYVSSEAAPAMTIRFRGNDRYAMGLGTAESRVLTDTRAEVVVHSWYGDGVIQIWEDTETGDVMVRPSVYSDRPGVKSVEYDLRGISSELKAVLPVFQGVRLPLDDELLVGRCFSWPRGWESGFAIFEGEDGKGFWLSCFDDKYNYKSLQMGSKDDPFHITVTSDAHGPLDQNRSAGAIAWRIGVFEGGWRAPAKIYRDWLWKAYNLEKQRRQRPEWLFDLKMAVSFCSADIEILKALETRVDPKKVLLHVSTWRDEEYDQNYPHYEASANASEVFAYGRERGFHIMPHLNSMQIDPVQPVHLLLHNMQLRDLDTGKVQGWAFDYDYWLKTDAAIDVPYSDFARVQPYNRKNNIMTTIHCGCSMWHSVLGEQVKNVTGKHNLDAAFVDVAFCTENNATGLVEGRSHAEGVNDLLRELSELNGGLVIGGENANEVTIQGQGVGQMHLYESWHFSKPGLERTGGDCAVAHFLYGDLCRMFGYTAISGKDENERMRMRIHDDHHCIPTFDCATAKGILEPNETVDRMLTEAGL